MRSHLQQHPFCTFKRHGGDNPFLSASIHPTSRFPATDANIPAAESPHLRINFHSSHVDTSPLFPGSLLTASNILIQQVPTSFLPSVSHLSSHSIVHAVLSITRTRTTSSSTRRQHSSPAACRRTLTTSASFSAIPFRHAKNLQPGTQVDLHALLLDKPNPQTKTAASGSFQLLHVPLLDAQGTKCLNHDR